MQGNNDPKRLEFGDVLSERHSQLQSAMRTFEMQQQEEEKKQTLEKQLKEHTRRVGRDVAYPPGMDTPDYIKEAFPTTFEKYGYLLIVIGVLLIGVGIFLLTLKPKPKDPTDPKAVEKAQSKVKVYKSLGIASIVVGALLCVVYVWKKSRQ
jgi:uncharacterized membrane protein